MKSGSSIGLKSIFMVVLMLNFLIPIHLSAQEAKYPRDKQENDTKLGGYITLKPGIYSPQSSDLKDFDFDTGFNGEIALGLRVNPNFEVETGVGYFYTEAEERFSGQFYDLTIAGKAEANIYVIPIVVTLKAILPYKQLDFFALGGIGAYWVFGNLKASGTVDGFSGRVELDDYDVIFGGHLGLGFHYNITPSIFVGAEGKYLWTSNARLQDETPDVRLDTKFKLDGILATGVVGFRF